MSEANDEGTSRASEKGAGLRGRRSRRPRRLLRSESKAVLPDKAGGTKVRLHDLHVSLLVKDGLDPRTIADRIGHRDPAFTLRQYSHAFEEQRQAAAVGLMDLLSPGTTSQPPN